MKKSRKILLGTLMACSLVGIGTATAFIVSGAHQDHTGAADAAVILNWGGTLQVDDIDTLSPGAPAFREITAKAPVVSESQSEVAGKVTFTLAKGNGAENAQFIGVKVEVATQSWSTSGTEAAGTIEVIEEDPTDGLTYVAENITTDTTFYLRVSIDQTIFNEYYAPRVDQATLSAELTISYGL